MIMEGARTRMTRFVDKHRMMWKEVKSKMWRIKNRLWVIGMSVAVLFLITGLTRGEYKGVFQNAYFL